MRNEVILDKINEAIDRNELGNSVSANEILNFLKQKLIEEIDSKETRKIGANDVLKGFKYVMKGTKKRDDDDPKFGYIFEFKNSNLTDDCYIVVSPQLILQYKGQMTFKDKSNVRLGKETPFMKMVFKKLKEYDICLNATNFVEVDLPTKGELKDIISETKSRNKLNKTKIPPVYCVKNTKLDINAEYLLKMMETGITKLYNLNADSDCFSGTNDEHTINCLIWGLKKLSKK